MKIALVTDAWRPQVNGVVRTLGETVARVRRRGHEVETITPDQFTTIACPSYPEIRLALGCGRAVRQRLASFAPDALHIATEGPLGWAARRWALAEGMPFTTSFHTRFPEYVAMRTGLPDRWFWTPIRRFHRPARAVFAATPALAGELHAQGLTQTHIWSRGVDLATFSPDNAPMDIAADLPRPIQLYVGRIAVEKNIEAFLACDTPGTKIVVGDGPARTDLEKRYPKARFLGALSGAPLSAAYASADVFVFPSRTDTFGLTMIEALASGVPVAGYPVRGPIDIIGDDRRVGALDEDLAVAIRCALSADRGACFEMGRRYDWERCTDQFLSGLAVERALLRAA